jgi:hypothetical protein
MTGGVLVELLFHLGAREAWSRNTLTSSSTTLRLVEYRPRHRRLLQDRPPDRFGLLLLALQLELARFLLPVFEGRFPGLDLDLADVQLEQPEERMAGVRLDHVDVPDGARQRHVEGIDEELVDLERLVALVLRPPVVERVDGQVGRRSRRRRSRRTRRDGRKQSGRGRCSRIPGPWLHGPKRAAVWRSACALPTLSSSRITSTANWVDWRVFWSRSRVVASLVGHQHHLPAVAADGLDEEVALAVDRAKALVLDLQQLVGHPRGLQTVAEIGRQHVQLLPLGELRVFPEQALDLTPGEEVGMDDLIRVAAEQEMTGFAQAS